MLNRKWVRLSAVSIIGLGVSSLAMGKATNYKVNPEKSVVTWVGKKVSGEHNGTIKVKGGTVLMENGKLKAGNFTLDMNSIDNNDLSGEWKTKLVNHLKSDDFFNVRKHPTGTFKTTKVVPGKRPNDYTVTGDLTIKSIKKPITFPVTVTMDKGMALAKANFKIDRLKWDIKYNSGKFFDPKKLGDKMIYDEIDVGLKLAAMTNAPQAKKPAQSAPKKKMRKPAVKTPTN